MQLAPVVPAMEVDIELYAQVVAQLDTDDHAIWASGLTLCNLT
jgi:hypothetical protein